MYINLSIFFNNNNRLYFFLKNEILHLEIYYLIIVFFSSQREEQKMKKLDLYNFSFLIVQRKNYKCKNEIIISNTNGRWTLQIQIQILFYY